MSEQNENEFHKKLDRFMRDKIETKLRSNPKYFSDRLAAVDVLMYLRSIIPVHQREEIECTAKRDGNGIAVNKLIDKMKRYFKFAFEFLRSLEDSGHTDIAEELLQGLVIDSLPPGENSSFVRKLARPSSSVATTPSHISGNILNDLGQDQSEKLRQLQSRSRSPPPPYQNSHSSIAFGISTGWNTPLSMNVVNSTTTTDNNPSAGPSLSNSDDDQSMSGAVAGGRSTSIPSSTIRERTSIVHADSNLDSKPDDDNTLVSDVHDSEIRASTSGCNTMIRGGESRDIPQERSSELEPTRYGAIIPSPVINARPSASSENVVPFDEQQTVPKKVNTQQNQYLSSVTTQDHGDPSQPNSLQKPSPLLDNGATMSTQGTVEELPAKNVEFGKKPISTGYLLGIDGASITQKSVENCDQGSAQENIQQGADALTMPNCHSSSSSLKDYATNVVVACLAALSVSLFVLKRFKHIE